LPSSWSIANDMEGGMSRPQRAPDDIDLERANAARSYDCFLGGSHNFAEVRAVLDLGQPVAVLPVAGVGTKR
jgi:hypothetical protein